LAEAQGIGKFKKNEIKFFLEQSACGGLKENMYIILRLGAQPCLPAGRPLLAKI